jgi:NAD(P)-dependent dehydrogenase (short-subunit alcohol dehydrogenase family)
MKNLEGKIAIVTGGASGIGLGIVKNFLAEGMKVSIWDFNDSHLAEARELFAGSNAVDFRKVDVANRDQVRQSAKDVIAVFGKIHVLCNNAGVAFGGTADGEDFDEWDRALAINLGGAVNGSKIVVPYIREHGEGGHVVNTSSMAGVVPLPGFGSYETAKYAVRGFTDALRMSLAPDGIGVSCLFPGATRSRMASMADPESEEAAAMEPELTKKLRLAFAQAMDPVELGAQVVRAIRENKPCIFTHGEFLDEVKAIHREIEQAFPQEQQVPEGRRLFEDARWREQDALHNMPAKDG